MISESEIDGAGALPLGRHLAQGCRELRVLDMVCNEIGAAPPPMEQDCWPRHLADGCRCLQKLGMSRNPLGESGAVAVAWLVGHRVPRAAGAEL